MMSGMPGARRRLERGEAGDSTVCIGARSRPLTGRTVLVVGAEPFARYGAASAIAGKFHVVDAVGTLAHAVRAVDRNPPSLCLLVCDPPLPDASLDVTLTELGNRPRTTIVGMFRGAQRYALDVARRAGIRGFVDTAATAAELQDALDTVYLGGVTVWPGLLPAFVGSDAAGGEAAERCDRLLTGAQLRALALLAEGRSSKEIARITGTTTAAVNHFVERATERLGAVHRAHAIACAFRLGLLS